jgi:hypothetical protein
VVDSGPGDGGKDKPAGEDYWKGIPPIQKLPRPGVFFVPPTGEGYYSLWDVLTDNYRKGPPKYPYPRVTFNIGTFFDFDWSYLDKPDNDEHDIFDCLKRIKFFDDCCMFTTGGEERIRLLNEYNSRLAGRKNDYTLYRTRVYGDLWITNRFRIFAEYIDARANGEGIAPLPIDNNYSDIQNLFVDVATICIDGSPVWVRYGRQELLYGSQRLISPLDWANTRRTFQGGKVFWKNDDFSFDAFCVQPMFVYPGRLDAPDNTQLFTGAWGTWRPVKDHQVVDLYYLNLDRDAPVFTGSNGFVGPGNINTFGSRYAGDYCNVLWDFEGMLQFGTYSNQKLFAGAYTASAGYVFSEVPMKPQFWLCYDWASGEQHPGFGGTRSTFQQLFPFGHYYFGFIDVVGRQNINDLNQQFTFYPTNWITCVAQNHTFWLDSASDALYNSAGAAIRRDPSGRSGSNVGDEIDFYVNFHLDNHQDILVGWSHLFAGSYLKSAPALNAAPGSTPGSLHTDADYFYVQYSFRW